jgi:hypothetical protein
LPAMAGPPESMQSKESQKANVGLACLDESNPEDDEKTGDRS